MNTSASKQRKARPVAGNRRNRVFDKSIMNEGVYNNPRLVQSALLLVGCTVQVEVKNGGVYEGIFKTLSPDGQIALEMAHKIDPQSPNGSIPTREMILQSLIFNLGDIVMINAAAVDMDFAVKDNFTDSAISKVNNGGTTEKELQPWESDTQDGSLETLEKGPSSNGWAPEEMFNTNADKFDIKSSYDPSLAQYTTPLVKQDTKEYREREARAAKLAQEIEKSEDCRRHMQLENGDGENEELLYSAVHRPVEANNSGATSAKYLPPHMRKVTQSQNRPNVRQTPPENVQSGSAASPHQQPSSISNSPIGLSSTSGTKTPSQSTPVHVSVSTVKQDQDNKSKNESDQGDRSRPSLNQPVTANHAGDIKKMNPKSRDKIQELKDFSTTFKLKDNESKENMDRRGNAPVMAQMIPQQQHGQPVLMQQQPMMQDVMMASVHMVGSQSYTALPHGQQPPITMQPPQQLMTTNADHKPVTTAVASAAVAVASDKKFDEKQTDEVKDKKPAGSKLNPLAMEFVPSASPSSNKPMTYRQPAPVPTPPRAATQSPVVLSNQPIYPYQFMVPNQSMMTNISGPRIANTAKRATVSAQAAAATGQPLLQTPMQAQNAQYPIQAYNHISMANTQAYQQNMVQMQGMRVITPQMMQGATTPTEQITFPQGQQHSVFMAHPGQAITSMSYIPTHHTMAGMPSGNQQGAPQNHTLPTHMAQHHHNTPPHSQNNHMSQQGGNPTGHPNPSPGPQHTPASHMPQQHHASNSGTPQPQLIYGTPNPQQGGPGHPPLQPSPHTPTSPQNLYVSMAPFSQSYTLPHMAFNSVNGQHPSILTMTNSAHHHQHPQLAMMSSQAGQGQHQVSHQMQHGSSGGPPQQHGQYAMNHPQLQQGHHMQGGAQMPGQAGPVLPINFVQQPHIVQQNPQHYHHNQ